MEAVPGNKVHFGQYLALLKGFCTTVQAMTVFDREHNLVWQNSAKSIDTEWLSMRLKTFRDSGNDGELTELDDGHKLEMLNLVNEHQEAGLILCLCHAATQNTLLPAAANENIGLLNEFLLVDFQQSLALSSKENELNHMTDELTRRYE